MTVLFLIVITLPLTRLYEIQISIDDLACILRLLKPAKSNGPDNIYVRLLLISGYSVITP